MYLFPGSCSNPAKPLPLSPRTSSDLIPSRPNKPLDFWYIASHDRETLVDHIMPYLAAQLPRKYLLQTFLEKHDWAREILGLEPTQMEDDGFPYLQQIMSAFWEDPSKTVKELLRLTRTWFYTLLRLTYRLRFFKRSKSYQTDVDLQDISSCESRPYISGLTESEIYRLTRVRNKYGASFYRSNYESVKQCLHWKRLCARIPAFCEMVGVSASLDAPEQNLKELQKRLTTAVLQRSWLQIAAQLDATSILAGDTARYVKEFDERVASEGIICLKQMEQSRREIGELYLQCTELRLAHSTLSCSQQDASKVFLDLQEQRRALGEQLKCLHSRIEDDEAKCSGRVANLAEQIEKYSTRSSNADAPEQTCPVVEALVACRWLLEHLPAASSKQQGCSSRWRLFWQDQWKQQSKSAGRDDHPLRSLIGKENYNRVGKNLYGTLSNFLHGYGHLRNITLHPDVQIVMDSISPVQYNTDGQIDLVAERERWHS